MMDGCGLKGRMILVTTIEKRKFSVKSYGKDGWEKSNDTNLKSEC